jgi:hypothetical protein
MKCIFKAKDQIEHIWNAFERCEITPPSTRANFISTMLIVAFNHCDGVQTLAEKKNFASSFALVRPLLESSFRAIWLHRCASEDELNKCIETDKWKSAWELVNEIEEKMEFSPILSKMWSELRPLMHSYTHGGVEIAIRHITDENTITPNISDQEVLQLMQIVGLISWLIYAEFIDISDSDEEIPLYEKMGLELKKWAF